MDRLQVVAIASLLLVAIMAGGAAIRLVITAGDLRAAATLGLVVLVVAGAIFGGAKGPRWRDNPYW